MRRPALAVACVFVLTPQLALANPYARAGAMWAQAAQPAPASQPQPTMPTQPQPTMPTTNEPTATDPSFTPTSSKAPKSDELETPVQPEPAPEAVPEPEPPQNEPPPVPEPAKW